MPLVHLLCPSSLEESQEGGDQKEVVKDCEVMAAPRREVPLHGWEGSLVLHVHVSLWALVVGFTAWEAAGCALHQLLALKTSDMLAASQRTSGRPWPCHSGDL